MKIALVFPGCHRRGGVERLVWEAATHFARAHEVTVVAESVDADAPAGAEIVRVEVGGPALARPAQFDRAVRAALRDRRFDVVVGFGAEYLGPDVAWVNSVHRAWLARARRGHGSVRERFGRYLAPAHQVVLLHEKRYFRRDSLRHVISVADAVTDDLVRFYAIDALRADTVHNGYDPADFAPERRAARRDAARAQFGFADDDVVALIVANELRRKGVATLVEAMARAGDPRLRVLLVGKTAPVDEMALAHRLGVADRFVFAGPTDDVSYAHAAADLFVLPTQYEAFCLAIVEALASGLPVITTTVPGAGDVVRPGETGLIQRDPRSARELAELLSHALQDDVRDRWSAAAPASVAQLTWPKLLARAEQILVRVAGPAGLSQ